MKLFSAYHENDYLFTGLNSKYRNECIEDVYEFFFDNDPSSKLKSIEDKESRLAGLNVVIEEHSELIPNDLD